MLPERLFATCAQPRRGSPTNINEFVLTNKFLCANPVLPGDAPSCIIREPALSTDLL